MPFQLLFSSISYAVLDVFFIAWRQDGSKDLKKHAMPVLIKLDPANPDLQCVTGVDVMQTKALEYYAPNPEDKTADRWDTPPLLLIEVKKLIEWPNVK